jgi:GNAT acetyltransferase-like protein
MRGYGSSAYAASLAEFGTPRLLSRSGGWVLERPIGQSQFRDAMGCYPLFSCTDWTGLEADVDALAADLISISVVTDPFGRYNKQNLQNCFRDKFIPFKTHYVADLRRRPLDSVAKHHRYYAKRALGLVDIERCDEPSLFLDEWLSLYDNLIRRHQLNGIKAFSRRSFHMQLAVPGIVMLRARHDGETLGAHLWYMEGDVIHSHLAAANARGYDLAVSYALYWFALETFADEAQWINFGAGAGLNNEDTDGLARFKKGWATETREAYFCGRIFDHEKYAEALVAQRIDNSDYFPAYRRGEFA